MNHGEGAQQQVKEGDPGGTGRLWEMGVGSGYILKTEAAELARSGQRRKRKPESGSGHFG